MSFIDNIRDFRKNKVISGLLDPQKEETLEMLTRLQNEISIAHDTKVIAITTINDSKLASSFALGFAKAYAKNGERTLIIDANLYDPTLLDVAENKENELVEINEMTSVICMSKEIYPSETFKSGTVNKMVDENKEAFKHILILVPSMRDHKEISLVKDILDSVLLITLKNTTRKGRIFDALAYLAQEQIPLSKVVVLK